MKRQPRPTVTESEAHAAIETLCRMFEDSAYAACLECDPHKVYRAMTKAHAMSRKHTDIERHFTKAPSEAM
jgi:hypothetical protein